jgi:hypothetical protein
MDRKNKQKGSALIYILIAIALLAALTATFMDSSSQQTTSQNTFNLVTDLNSQINFVRSAIQECVLTYPAGDSTMPADPALVGGEAVTRPYPLQPENTYLLNPESGTVGVVDAIRCPGNPGDSNDHAKIFSGSSGKFLAPTPKLTWRKYINDVDGVYLLFGIWTSDAYLKTALEKLNDQFAPCEADVIDASTGGDVNISSTGDVLCEDGNICLRVWLVTNPATAVFPTEPSCP